MHTAERPLIRASPHWHARPYKDCQGPLLSHNRMIIVEAMGCKEDATAQHVRVPDLKALFRLPLHSLHFKFCTAVSQIT
jgi:hypothetical protein